MVKILLQKVTISYILNLFINSCIISETDNVRFRYILVNIRDHNQEKQESQHCVLVYWGISTNATWESHKMRAVYEEVIKPHIKVPSNSKCFQCMKENAMVHMSMVEQPTSSICMTSSKTFNRADRHDRPLLNPCWVLFKQP